MTERNAKTLKELFEESSEAFLLALQKGGWERLVGAKLLNYIGMLLVVLAGAFFLKYTAALVTPAGKLAICLLSGLGVVALGEFLHRDERYAVFSLPLVGGGWSIVYYTAFAAHYVPATRVIGSAAVDLVLLCLVAAAMIAHSLRIRSRVLTAFSFGVAYLAFALTHIGMPSVWVCAVLACAGALLVRQLASPELSAVNLAGFYLNYFPVFGGTLFAQSRGALPAWDFWSSLAAATAVHVLFTVMTPMKLPPKEGESEDRWMDVALSLSAILYASMFYAQTSAYAPLHGAAGLMALAGVLCALSTLRGPREDGSALSRVQALLGAAVLALAVFRLDSAGARCWGFALSASILGTLGLWLDRRSFERYGLAMLGLAFLHHWMSGASAAHSSAAYLSLGYLGATGYALTSLRENAGREDARISAAWVYGGFFAVISALSSYFEPPAFILAAFSMALVLEGLDAEGSPVLLRQALLLEVGAALFYFSVDFGANRPVFWALTPRLLATGGAVAALALVLGRRTAEDRLLGIPHPEWRRVCGWLMTFVGAFGVYEEFGPRLRLPIWAAGALLLLIAGCRRRDTVDQPDYPDFRIQAYLLALTAAAEGVVSYLLQPELLLGPLGPRETVVYWGASLALAAPLFFKPWARTPAELVEAETARHIFGALSLLLPALFIAKEADGAFITLGWSWLAVTYLTAGLFSDTQALRLPGLVLLGICILKALFMDITGLALPYRVLSYATLGIILVASSYLYVHFTGKEPCHEK